MRKKKIMYYALSNYETDSLTFHRKGVNGRWSTGALGQWSIGALESFCAFSPMLHSFIQA
jgi:hypothetical protein